MKTDRGIFITFEGADGVGKSTQANLLCDYFAARGMKVRLTREPGGTFTGEKVREILLDLKCDMGKRTEALLYLAVRAEHVDKVVMPELENGGVVISDRFSDSTFVYQGVARGLDIKELACINAFASSNIQPDITFLLDAPVEELGGRIAKRGEEDRIEKEGLAFQKLVRSGFLQMAQKYPDRIIVLDAKKSIDEIQETIRNNIEKKISGLK